MSDEEFMTKLHEIKVQLTELESNLDSALKTGETGDHLCGAILELNEIGKWLKSDRDEETVPISGDVRCERATDSGF